MKIAVMTDVHANLPALRVALDEISAMGCDKIIHTGDLIGIGPHPRECMELMQATPDVHFVMGNHDALFDYGLPSREAPEMSLYAYEHELWTHNQLEASWRADVLKWPYALRKSCSGIRLAFMHYGWNVADQTFCDVMNDPTPQDYDRMFGGNDHDLVFYGHSHVASDVQGRARYINPGALGCHEPAARFVVLNLKGSGEYEIEKHAVPYDPRLLIEDLKARNVPDRELICETFFNEMLQGV